MLSELLSHRLVAFREKHGLTLAALAEILGVTSRYLSYLEAGTKDIGPESSLFKLFVAYEAGQLPLKRGLGFSDAIVREEPPRQINARNADSIGDFSGLSTQDALAQVRADLAMIEGGSQSDRRRAYHFLRQVHLPMLAKMMKLE